MRANSGACPLAFGVQRTDNARGLGQGLDAVNPRSPVSCTSGELCPSGCSDPFPVTSDRLRRCGMGRPAGLLLAWCAVWFAAAGPTSAAPWAEMDYGPFLTTTVGAPLLGGGP